MSELSAVTQINKNSVKFFDFELSYVKLYKNIMMTKNRSIKKHEFRRYTQEYKCN